MHTMERHSCHILIQWNATAVIYSYPLRSKVDWSNYNGENKNNKFHILHISNQIFLLNLVYLHQLLTIISITDGDSLVSWSSFFQTFTCQLIMLQLFSRGNNFNFVQLELNW